jgi:hypothetical protein
LEKSKPFSFFIPIFVFLNLGKVIMKINNLLKFSLLISVVTLAVSCGSSRINKETSMHEQMKNNSKINNEAIVSLDTVFYKGEPYCILNESGMSLSPFYHFSTLTGVKSIDVIPYSAGDGKAVTHHEYRFLGTSVGMSGYLDYSFSTISVVENVINNNLLNTNELRPIDVGNFVKNNPRPPKFNPAQLKVVREMSLAIKINQGYGEIYQGDKKIGTFLQGKEKTDEYPVENAKFKVNFLNNTHCATVIFPNGKFERNEQKYLVIITEFEGKVHRLTIKADNMTFDVDAFKQGVEYLVEKGYL